MSQREFDAEIVLMHPAVVGHRQDCWIFNDKLKTGNHPFGDGKWVHTSTVMEIVEENGDTFLITRSGTTYKVLGEGREEAARTLDAVRGLAPMSETGLSKKVR